MDALITAAGLGTRANVPRGMRKEMLPLYAIRNGKIVLRPVLDCIMHNLSDSGVRKFFVVLDHRDLHTADYLSTLRMKTEFIYQKKPEGYGKAVSLARDYIKGDFILNAGDGIIIDTQKIKKIINLYKKTGNSVLTIMSVLNPEKYGVAYINSRNVTGVVEKPENPESNYALAAFYVFRHDVLDLVRGTELTPAINKFITKGNTVEYFKIRKDDWISIGNSDNYFRLLERTYRFCKKSISS